MYIERNPKNKKELKTWIAEGKTVYAFSPGPFPCPKNGWVSVEGPHYPKPHSWYAQVLLENGVVVKVK